LINNFKAQLQSQPKPPPTYAPSAPYPGLNNSRPEVTPYDKNDTLYPTLNEWMGLSLTSQEVTAIQNDSNAISVRQNQTICLGNNSMVAPISSTSMGLIRANVTHGIREVVVCKDGESKVGLRVKDINKV
jgi:syntenin-1